MSRRSDDVATISESATTTIIQFEGCHESKHPQNKGQHMSELLAYLGGLATAGFIELLVTHRDRESRRHADGLARNERLAAYESFLLEWEHKIESSGNMENFKEFFGRGSQSLFRSRAATVRRDFLDRTEFNRLEEALSRMTLSDVHPDVAFDPTRQKLLDAIKPLIQYVKSA